MPFCTSRVEQEFSHCVDNCEHNNDDGGIFLSWTHETLRQIEEYMRRSSLNEKGSRSRSPEEYTKA